MSVTPDRCYMLHQFALRATRLQGDMAECGVFQGGTAHLLAQTLRDAEAEVGLHLFDTFEGMPDFAERDRDYHDPGDFGGTSLRRVQARLGAYDFVTFHPGVVPDSFSELDPETRFSFIHVDMDIYTSTIECCRGMWPRLVAGGVMIFDDYGFFPYRAAARAAVDEFFAELPDRPIVLPTGQAFVIKT